MIDDLSMALRNSELVIKCQHTIAELRTFVRNERGSMSGSPHDDRVMALALANQMRKFAFVPEYVQDVDDTYTFDWWMRKANKREPVGDTIGLNTVRGTA
jgi:hypothetical protein